uniref:Uncharacterized protein n=1 Tax=viral metagenome TaxID=1070528 RepID=A0A6C0KRA1_9ZZZZ
MPSIFIWKATTPLPSSTILYYAGANWFLEEHATYSYSYQYENQIKLSNEVIAYQAIKMPHDWVGSEIFETITIGYQLIREDSNGILEQIGEWMRYRSKCDHVFERNALEAEYAAIHVNVSRTTMSTPSRQSHRKCNNTNENDICLIRFHGISG